MRSFTALGVVVAIAGASTPFVILAFRHRALAHKVRAHREATEDEREGLRRRGRASLVGFVAFWLVALGLIAFSTLLRPSALVEQLVFGIIVVMAIVMLALHLGTRCPICNYRLGYQRSLGVPSRCERCGATVQ